jgi:cephalosporin hydroxylase
MRRIFSGASASALASHTPRFTHNKQIASHVTAFDSKRMLSSKKPASLVAPKQRFVSIEQRPIASDLPSSFWKPIAHNSAAMSWKSIPMQKGPFQIVVTQQLVQELNPKTIIEFGSFKGGSALWVADIQQLSGRGSHVFSVDIDLSHLHPTVKKDPRITFIQGDSHHVEEVFPLEKLSALPRPMLLIEDAHINTIGILEHFDKTLKNGDYIIVEDTNIHYNNECYNAWRKQLSEKDCLAKLANLNNKLPALNAWLAGKPHRYAVDTNYTDPFGILNGTKNWNSVLKKIA